MIVITITSMIITTTIIINQIWFLRGMGAANLEVSSRSLCLKIYTITIIIDACIIIHIIVILIPAWVHAFQWLEDQPEWGGVSGLAEMWFCKTTLMRTVWLKWPRLLCPWDITGVTLKRKIMFSYHTDEVSGENFEGENKNSEVFTDFFIEINVDVKIYFDGSDLLCRFHAGGIQLKNSVSSWSEWLMLRYIKDGESRWGGLYVGWSLQASRPQLAKASR